MRMLPFLLFVFVPRSIFGAIRWHWHRRHAAAGVCWWQAGFALTRWRLPMTADYKRRTERLRRKGGA